MKFKILHTNDVHSRFENFSRIVIEIREIEDENSIILDAGDFHDFKDIMLQGTDGAAGGELLWEAGYRGRFLGKLHVSGAVIKHDERNIKSITINGNEMQEDKWYTVATSDYLQRGSGYQSLSNNREVKYNPEYIRITLKDYLCKKEFVEKSFIDRWVKE